MSLAGSHRLQLLLGLLVDRLPVCWARLRDHSGVAAVHQIDLLRRVLNAIYASRLRVRGACRHGVEHLLLTLLLHKLTMLRAGLRELLLTLLLKLLKRLSLLWDRLRELLHTARLKLCDLLSSILPAVLIGVNDRL